MIHSMTGEIEQADAFKEKIYTAMVQIEKHVCAPITSTSHSPTRRSEPESVSLEPPPTRSSHSTRVKLPKLALRSFNGNITTWTTFWDSFESSIHNNTDLSEIDKFNYLKSLLEGTAREAISGLTLTSTNYKEAIAILKKRFGNKQQIISKHMDILLEEPSSPV